jgi:hypothetical protein
LSNSLGAASYEVVLRVASRMLEGGISCIVEANFSWSEPFSKLPPAHIVQLLCTAATELVVERYASRVRHPGHVDQQRRDEVRARIDADEWRPLDIGGELIVVDTTDRVDVAALAERLRA